MACRVTKGLVAEFPARKQVPLLDEPSMAAFLSLDLSLMQCSRLFLFFGENLERQYSYQDLSASLHMKKLDPSTETPMV